MPFVTDLPHHDGSPLYVSTDSPQLGDIVKVRVRVPSGFGPVTAVRTRSNPNHEPVFTVASPIASLDGWEWWEAEVTVENPVHGYRFLFTLADGAIGWLNARGWSSTETLDSEDFKLVTYAPPPEWAQSTVLYQIFPDRFARSEDADARALPVWAEQAAWTDEPIHIGPSTPRQFYGGDLKGIEEHLDHLVALGVTLIYLTPVFPAHSNHRYDALSFTTVDPLLGGDDALISLVQAAHGRGLRVIGDLTSNHSGDAHEWFTSSHLSPGTPESEFYYWHDAEQKSYESWLGVPSLPKFNWNSGELRRRFIEGPDSVVAKWLKAPYNFDGWRIDVANMTGRYLDEDHNTDVRRIIRRTMIDVNPETILLGESTNDAIKDFQGDAWHGAMTYANFTRPLWSWLSEPGSPARGGLNMPLGIIPGFTGEQFYAAHSQFVAGFPWRTRLHTMNALDTHDTPRFLTHALPGTVPVAFGLAVTLPGIPVVFAGDEFGLIGDDGEHSRSPIPWQLLEPTADQAYAAHALDSLALYTQLVHLRRDHAALNGGGIRWLAVTDDVVAFVRESAHESVLVVAAKADFDVTLSATAIACYPVLLVGEAFADNFGSGIRLAGSGPSFTAWQLPGIATAAF
ncbi:maltodextrin glucosidase [soil metagenome]